MAPKLLIMKKKRNSGYIMYINVFTSGRIKKMYKERGNIEKHLN